MTDNVDARPRATLLLTRPRAASERFAAEIGKRGLPLDIVIAPLMEIAPVGPARCSRSDDAFIFTSANAVPPPVPASGAAPGASGERHGGGARDAGFDAVEAGACADALVDGLLRGTPPAHLCTSRPPSAR
jgi:uroporphyrinogen-III synthase